MSGQTQTFRVRPAAENGGRDTLSVAAEALLQGSGLPITRANVNAAIRDIAAANGLQPVRIVQRVNAETDQQQVTIYAGNRVLMQGRWHTPAGNPDFAPEPGTGRNIYDCEWIEYRSQGGRRAIQPGDELREPPQEKYQGFGPGGPQIVSDCVTCVTPPPVVRLAFETAQGQIREESGPAAGQVRAALPDYVNGGSLGDGRTSEFYDVWDLPRTLNADFGPQPHTAARGTQRSGTGAQTGAGTLGHVAAWTFGSLSIPLGSVAVNYLPSFILGAPASADRVRWAREGGNGAQDRDGENRYPHSSLDVAGRDGRFDGWPFNGRPLHPISPSERTLRDATLVPGVGVEFDEQGRIVNNTDSAFGNNQGFYESGMGDYAPSITGSQREATGRGHNRFLQGQPASEATNLRGFQNYPIAYYVNETYLQPRISGVMYEYERESDPARRRELAQAGIELLNYQSNLFGASNYDVNANVTALARRGTPLSADELIALNPAERIAYTREALIVNAAENGITGLDRNAQPREMPIRSVDRETLRNGMVEWYVEMASGPKSGDFRGIYERELRESPEFDRNDPASVRAAVERFVDSRPYITTYPERGFTYDHLENYITRPRDRFNPVERGEYAPQQRDGLGISTVEPAMTVLASDPAITRMVLGASTDTDVAQSFANYDNLRVQIPRSFGGRRMHLDRGQLLAETAARGYGEDVMGSTFSREETNGIIRNLPGVQRDLIASAQNDEIVALRQRDLVDMATNNDNHGVGKGAPAIQLLYSLAKEPDNRTLLAVEEHIRANAASPAEAEQQIETLRQGVEYARNNVSQEMMGISHSALIDGVAARSLRSPGVAAAQATGSYTVEETETAQVVVAGNVRTLFGQFAQPASIAGGQAFLTAVASQSEANRAALLSTAAGLPAEQQLVVARAAIGGNTAAVNALVASSGLDDATKAAFTAASGNLTAANAGVVLAALAQVPAASQGAITAIAGNREASTAVLNGLAGAPDVASQLSVALTDAQRADVATRANLDPEIRGTVWSQVAPQEVTNTVRRVTPITRLTPPGADKSAMIAAASTPDAYARNANMAVQDLQRRSTQERVLNELANTNPDVMVVAVANALAANPELANGFKGQMTSIGGGRGGLFGTGVGLPGGRHSAHHQLGDALADLTHAQARGDQRGIDRATGRISAVLTAAQGGDAQAQQAVSALTTALAATPGVNDGPNGTAALVTALTTGLSRAQVDPANSVFSFSPLTGETLVNNVTATLSNIDYANPSALSNHTFNWAVANASTVSGLIVPFVIHPLPESPSNPDTNTGQVGGCLPNCPPAPPTPPVISPPGQPNLGP